MTIPGPKPKPTALRLVEGSKSHRPQPPGREPEFREIMPKTPPHLGNAGKKEWRRMAKILRSMHLLTEAGVAGLAAYCEAYEQAMKVYPILEKTPFIKETRFVGSGEKMREYSILKENPAFALWEKSRKIMRLYMTEFGMTPSSATRLRIEKDTTDDDEFEGLLSKAR